MHACTSKGKNKWARTKEGKKNKKKNTDLPEFEEAVNGGDDDLQGDAQEEGAVAQRGDHLRPPPPEGGLVRGPALGEDLVCSVCSCRLGLLATGLCVRMCEPLHPICPSRPFVSISRPPSECIYLSPPSGAQGERVGEHVEGVSLQRDRPNGAGEREERM